jgi:hypothetical protein
MQKDAGKRDLPLTHSALFPILLSYLLLYTKEGPLSSTRQAEAGSAGNIS